MVTTIRRPPAGTSATTTTNTSSTPIARVSHHADAAPVPSSSSSSADGFATSSRTFDVPRTDPTARPGVPAALVRASSLAAGASPNDAIVHKTLDLIMAEGGVTSRKQLVHEHRFVDGNHVDFLIDGGEAFPPLLDDLRAAQKSIHVSFYIFADDKLGNELADVLIDRAKHGVDVHLSVDGIGSVQVLGSPMRKIIDRMIEGGVKVVRNHVVDPLRETTALNHPDHRKIVLVDGVIGYTGGMNIADHYRDGYHDIMIRVQGPVVQQMQVEWALSYDYLDGKIRHDGETRDQLRERLFPRESANAHGSMRARVIQAIPGENKEIFKETLRLIAEAEKTIRIENPYCTNPEIQQALTKAAKRGVDVEVILPGESDHAFSHLAARAAYPDMIKAGVKIYEYPGFNHDKVMVVDDKIVSVGSSNFDDVALRHIYEMNLIIEDEGLAKDIAARLFEIDRKKSRVMRADDTTQLQQLTGSFWSLFHDII
jgi:cardiolipin synthase